MSAKPYSITSDDITNLGNLSETNSGDQDAGDVSYDNTFSGLIASDVQEVIDELAGSTGGFIPKVSCQFNDCEMFIVTVTRIGRSSDAIETTVYDIIGDASDSSVPIYTWYGSELNSLNVFSVDRTYIRKTSGYVLI